MSTAAIAAVLKWAKVEHGDVEPAADEGLRKLSAIRRAAKALTSTPLCGAPWTPEQNAALALLSEIAKEET